MTSGPGPMTSGPGPMTSGPGPMAKGAEDELMTPDVLDKPFDQLLAQQRELISEYFKQSGDRTGSAAGQAPAQPAGQEGGPGPRPDVQEGYEEPPRSAAVSAEPPRVW